MIIDAQPRVLVAGDAVLGEGPMWDPRDQSLWWVDIKRPTIFRWRVADERLDRWVPPVMIASLCPHAGGGFVAGGAHGFMHIDPERGHYTPIDHPERDRPQNRFNDGKLDRHGRFWAGTMDDAHRARSGALYRLDHDHSVTRAEDGYGITNGPAFDRVGNRAYHTDTAHRAIYAFDLDAHGALSGKRVFAQFDANEGHPDGMTVDAEDCLWVAFWGGHCLRRFAPDGLRLTEIALPVAQPTSCTFGGRDLDILFVTSASIGLDRAAHPHDGSVIAFRPGMRGIADVPFAGKLPA